MDNTYRQRFVQTERDPERLVVRGSETKQGWNVSSKPGIETGRNKQKRPQYFLCLLTCQLLAEGIPFHMYDTVLHTIQKSMSRNRVVLELSLVGGEVSSMFLETLLR